MKDIFNYRRGNDITYCFVNLYSQCRNSKFKIINDHVNNYMRKEQDDKKYYDEFNKCRILFFDKNFNEALLFLIEGYDKVCLRFLKENKVMKYREASRMKKEKHREASKNKNEVYHAMQDFLNHNKLCSDIKTHILSFVFRSKNK